MAEQPSIRVERDGGVASIVLDNPPLNLFGDDSFQALVDCIEEIEGSDARAAVWRAEGKIFSGGVDVSTFQQVVDGGAERAGAVLGPVDRCGAEAGGAADPDARALPRNLPHSRARDCAGLRHDLGR